jgi:D-3-phosphoglycerate dehydrogenase / 2-oxoglutarate reductase
VSDPVEALVRDLCESLAARPRPYEEVMDAWKTSCPRLPVWEEANRRGLIRNRPDRQVELTEAGRRYLASCR